MKRKYRIAVRLRYNPYRQIYTIAGYCIERKTFWWGKWEQCTIEFDTPERAIRMLNQYTQNKI